MRLDLTLKFRGNQQPHDKRYKDSIKDNVTPRFCFIFHSRIFQFQMQQNCALFSHLATPTRSHLIGDYPSGLTKEQRTETMNPSPYPMKFRACRSCEATHLLSRLDYPRVLIDPLITILVIAIVYNKKLSMRFVGYFATLVIWLASQTTTKPREVKPSVVNQQCVVEVECHFFMWSVRCRLCGLYSPTPFSTRCWTQNFGNWKTFSCSSRQ